MTTPRTHRDARYRARWNDILRPRRTAVAADDYETSLSAKVCADYGCTATVTRFARCAACRRKRAAWNAAYRERLGAALAGAA